eukprot:1230257-Rhodomonas_salina.2
MQCAVKFYSPETTHGLSAPTQQHSGCGRRNLNAASASAGPRTHVCSESIRRVPASVRRRRLALPRR